MSVGVISGSGTESWPGVERVERRVHDSVYGQAELTAGIVDGIEVLHVSRHGPAHQRLSNHVDHRANMAALIDAGVEVVVSLTVCGAIRSDLPLGGVVVFDDLYFPSNRLPDGSLCTWHDTSGRPGRGHWIFDQPFDAALRGTMVEAAGRAGVETVDGGCYGHVDGPRFNSRAEIRALAAAGVTALSQTAGPEVVLAGEARLPMVLLGYLTDYATGVAAAPEPLDALLARVKASTAALAAVVNSALPALAELAVMPAGTVHTFEP
ncbi:MAG: MTAP family purine nucleoside phosphorylase [Acidobacteriota bacterium]|nr:MTAP family purine nucleoside phosphorylase [Acidobacteriota bacterium]